MQNTKWSASGPAAPHAAQGIGWAAYGESFKNIYASGKRRNTPFPQQETANLPGRIDPMRIPLFHVDAFIGHPFRDNPAAACFLDSWLDEAQLRKVAAENNLSATAFLVRRDGKHRTAVVHATLVHATSATAHVLLNPQTP